MTIVVTMKDGDGKYILSNSEVGVVGGGGVQTLTAKLIGSKTYLMRYCVFFIIILYIFKDFLFSRNAIKLHLN